MAEIALPALGESVTEGTITRWFKQVGDRVEVDEILFEVSTDKIDTEVPSPVAGVIQELRVPEGETVDVGTVIAVVGDAAAPSVEPSAPVPAEPVAAEPVAAEPAVTEPAVTEPVAAEPASVAAEVASVHPPAGETPAGETPAGETPAGETPAGEHEAAAAGAAEGAGGPTGLLLSPMVRQILTAAGIDPARVAGTGVGGRITREDALRAADGKGTAGAAAPIPAVAPVPTAASIPDLPAAVAPAAAAPAADAPAAVAPAAVAPAISEGAPSEGAAPSSVPGSPAPSLPGASPQAVGATSSGGAVPTSGDGRPEAEARSPHVIPFNRIRKITGDAMVASKSISPHVITAVEADFEGVERVRTAARERFASDEGFSLTYLPFVARAVVDTLAEFPKINATVADDGLVVYPDVNLAIAVDLNHEGLLAPVVRGADGKRLRAIARDIHELAGRARGRTLSPDDLLGGTFTISNSGAYGTLLVAPVINQPQVAILSTDGVRRRAVVVTDEVGSESLAIHSVGTLTLSWDHRAFDGAYAAAFMDRLRDIIETRDWSAEL